MSIPLRHTTDERSAGRPRHDLGRTLTARIAAILAGRRPATRILDECPRVGTLTLVVADLAAAAAAWSTRLGGHGEPLDPAEFDEPGLAQQFDLGPCPLILFQPTEDTDAGDFLRDHGDGLYTITLRGSTLPTARQWTAHYPLVPLPPPPYALSSS
ncbi:MAG: hypothetical protein AVDCRST_MAG18-5214 [uncultured Thermomicrobiales bacterium]|uniref:Uncharacterized protein n=1 Tax=uncultured Thermomicrobiales bacterium TaxID=1645740 RepID=A0A6J4VYG6_9BACT|nr:MAG: hypothetical protein AVDCRST_MAG18-5214 [uncultured Thermomicrobiales bacterium]